MINANVSFYGFTIENLIIESQKKGNAIIVEAAEDESGEQNCIERNIKRVTA